MRSFFVLLLMAKLNVVYSQFSKDSVDIYISKLNWSSVTITPTIFPKLLLNDDAKNILKINDNNLNQKLYNHLGEKEKTLVLHILLTKRFESKNISVTPGESYLYKNDTVTVVNYTYNHLHWSLNIKGQTYCISDKEVNRIKVFWRRRLQNKT